MTLAQLRSWPGLERRRPSVFTASYLHLRELTRTLRWVVAGPLAGRTELMILDVGCSRRPYFPLFAPLARAYVGVDISRSRADPDCLARGEALPFRDGSFDLVLSTQMLAYGEAPQAIVEEMRRVLRANGVAIVSTHGLYPYVLDYWRFTHRGLERLLASAGFDEVRIIPSGGAALCLFQLIALYLNVLGGSESAALRSLLIKALIAVNNVVGLGLDRLLSGRGWVFCCANYVALAWKAAKS